MLWYIARMKPSSERSTSLGAYIKMCLFTRKINNVDADVVVYLWYVPKLFDFKWPHSFASLVF